MNEKVRSCLEGMMRARTIVLGSLLLMMNCQSSENPPIIELDCQVELGKPLKRHCEALSHGIPPTLARLNTLNAANIVRNSNPPPPNLKWEFIGPSPLIDDERLSVTGRMDSIAVDPRNPNRWLAGSAAGGIFETVDQGASWKPIQDQESLPLLGVSAIAFHPNAPDIIYAGTGEPYEAGDAYGGLGLFRSFDSGKSWQLMPGPFSGAAISDIVLDPNDAKAVVVGSIYALHPATQPLRGRYGVFRSIDSGQNWDQTLTNAEVSDLDYNRLNAQQIYAGGITNPDNNARLWRSLDGGKTFSEVDGPWKTTSGSFLKVKIALSPTNPNVLYVSAGYKQLDGLWKSTNAWSETPSFQPIDTSATGPKGYCAAQCWYSHTVAVSTVDENIIYAGGISLWKYDGSKWTNIGRDLGPSRNPLHVDQHALIVIPAKKFFIMSIDRILVANDGGIFESKENGDTWIALNKGLNVTQFWSGDISSDGKVILGGAQDNGTSIYSRSSSDRRWEGVSGGDGFDAIASRMAENKFVATVQHTSIRRSIDAGKTFEKQVQGIPTDEDKLPFVTRVRQCPFDDNVHIANIEGGIVKTMNFFSTSENPLWLEQSSGSEVDVDTSALGFSKRDDKCNVYAYGNKKGSIFVTLDGGSKWKNVSISTSTINNSVSAIEFTPKLIPEDSAIDQFFISYSGFDVDHIVRVSCDEGFFFGVGCGGWGQVDSLGFPVDIPVRGIAHDAASDTLFAGTDASVWMLRNSTTCSESNCQWTNFGLAQGIPNVPIYQVSIAEQGRSVVAYTHGRGAYWMDISSL